MSFSFNSLEMEKNSPTSGKGSTISQLGTDRKNMATFCMAVSVGKYGKLIII
mgnify:CR=1 FL=1